METDTMKDQAFTGSPILQRTIEMAAIFMIGDGMLGLFQPRRHLALWEGNALGAERLVRPFAGRSNMRRAYGAVQIAAGLMLAARQTDQ